MHQRTQVKEHVVEGVDGQASSFISIFQRYDGRVQGVGQVTETWTACFDHFLGTLQRGWIKKDRMINHWCRQTDKGQWGWVTLNLLWRRHQAFVPVSQRCQQKKEDRRSWSNEPCQDQLQGTPSASHPESSLPQTLCAPGPARSVTVWGERRTVKKKTGTQQQSMVRWRKSSMTTLVLSSFFDYDRILNQQQNN